MSGTYRIYLVVGAGLNFMKIDSLWHKFGELKEQFDVLFILLK